MINAKIAKSLTERNLKQKEGREQELINEFYDRKLMTIIMFKIEESINKAIDNCRFYINLHIETNSDIYENYIISTEKNDISNCYIYIPYRYKFMINTIINEIKDNLINVDYVIKNITKSELEIIWN